ncbi:MAG: hypothetical protein H6737_27250 [Alphaproteobacteria bacterium]|nr:hypothetical protein [Alphaproteobacteria bacterium]
MARAELFDDLVAFGGELGFVGVERVEGSVTLRRVERWLRFSEDGPGGDVIVDFTGRDPNADHRLYREPALDDRWIWVRRRRGKEDRVPLFDQGLELLLVHALELDAPEDEPAAPPPAPARSEAPAPTEPSDGPAPVKRSL